MPSASHHRWEHWSALALDGLVHAHGAVGRTARGRRARTEIHHGSVLLLAAHFQAYCRDLHTEATDHIVRAAPARIQALLREALSRDRKIDRGNANAGHLGADFGRFDMDFWLRVQEAAPKRIARWRRLLDQLMSWRNAIAHQDLNRFSPDPPRVVLSTVQTWLSSCVSLAKVFDGVVGEQVRLLAGKPPW